jgi:hypothetical protein
VHVKGAARTLSWKWLQTLGAKACYGFSRSIIVQAPVEEQASRTKSSEEVDAMEISFLRDRLNFVAVTSYLHVYNESPSTRTSVRPAR